MNIITVCLQVTICSIVLGSTLELAPQTQGGPSTCTRVQEPVPHLPRVQRGATEVRLVQMFGGKGGGGSMLCSGTYKRGSSVMDSGFIV